MRQGRGPFNRSPLSFAQAHRWDTSCQPGSVDECPESGHGPLQHQDDGGHMGSDQESIRSQMGKITLKGLSSGVEECDQTKGTNGASEEGKVGDARKKRS